MSTNRDHRVYNLVNVFVMLEPADYLPPRLPDEVTDELKGAWFRYADLWSSLRAADGVEPNEDTLGQLWSLYLELRAMGVEFDPLFCKALDEIGTLAVNVDTDREPEDWRDEAA
ncbi:hypothetical protein ACERK3_09750 [Phycisphaerales bacterium AB-hyl4]|uniref:Uncharacterized protein n=1 Tax=Natronomicrosphaera hydrolytica TaxID=3242702 RepID=A0ABV4U4Q2_9BACT